MTGHGWLPNGQAWNLVQRGGNWELIVGWDYADETYRRVYQGSLEDCRARLLSLRRRREGAKKAAASAGTETSAVH